jgi:hypothetical protein
MADKKEKPAKADKKEKAAKGGGKKSGKVKLFLLLLVIIGVALPAAGMVMLVGMLPVLAMGMTDRTRTKSLTVCVGSLNAAGVSQALLQLIRNGSFTPDYGQRILSDPQNLIIMWGAAAIGLGLFTFIPAAVGQVLVGVSQMKIAKLRVNQQELKRIWGEQVGG